MQVGHETQSDQEGLNELNQELIAAIDRAPKDSLIKLAVECGLYPNKTRARQTPAELLRFELKMHQARLLEEMNGSMEVTHPDGTKTQHQGLTFVPAQGGIYHVSVTPPKAADLVMIEEPISYQLGPDYDPYLLHKVVLDEAKVRESNKHYDVGDRVRVDAYPGLPITVEVLIDMLGLVDIRVAAVQVEAWTEEQRMEAAQWAADTYVGAGREEPPFPERKAPPAFVRAAHLSALATRATPVRGSMERLHRLLWDKEITLLSYQEQGVGHVHITVRADGFGSVTKALTKEVLANEMPMGIDWTVSVLEADCVYRLQDTEIDMLIDQTGAGLKNLTAPIVSQAAAQVGSSDLRKGPSKSETRSRQRRAKANHKAKRKHQLNRMRGNPHVYRGAKEGSVSHPWSPQIEHRTKSYGHMQADR